MKNFRLLLTLPALLAAHPAAAQATQRTAEALQAELDRIRYDQIRVILFEGREDAKKTWFSHREIAGSRMLRRCVTEFSVPKVVASVNTKPSATYVLDWRRVTRVSSDTYKVELEHRDKALRTEFQFDLADMAPAFEETFELIRRQCAG